MRQDHFSVAEAELSTRTLDFAERLKPGEARALAADLSKLRAREGLNCVSFELLMAAKLVLGRFERPAAYHRPRSAEFYRRRGGEK